jgi:hypothetical protein
MSRHAGRTRGMKGIAQRTRIKRRRKLQSCKTIRMRKKNIEKKKKKKESTKMRDDIRKTNCIPEYVV